jgi:DNA-binding NtrC family response regulator
VIPLDSRQDDQKTILVVDRHAKVLNSLSALLIVNSYHVLGARSGVEAIRRSKDYTGEIHLLLSEVQLPGMSGVDLAGEISLARPQIKVLLMSSWFSVRDAVQPGMAFSPKAVQVLAPAQAECRSRERRQAGWGKAVSG